RVPPEPEKELARELSHLGVARDGSCRSRTITGGRLWLILTIMIAYHDRRCLRTRGREPALAVADVPASKRFYIDRGFAVAKSCGRKFVSFAAPSGAIELVLYGGGGAAKDAGVFPDGSGSDRSAIVSGAGPFTDPDGFVWEAPRSDWQGAGSASAAVPTRPEPHPPTAPSPVRRSPTSQTA